MWMNENSAGLSCNNTIVNFILFYSNQQQDISAQATERGYTATCCTLKTLVTGVPKQTKSCKCDLV